MTVLSDKLLRARKKLNRTQGQVAQEVGVTRAYIAEMEHGTRKVSRSMAPHMARALRMPVEVLLFHIEVVETAEFAHLPDEAIVRAYTLFYQSLRAAAVKQVVNNDAELQPAIQRS